MPWVSGYPAVCLHCKKAGGLTLLDESYDGQDHVFVGEVVCSLCEGHSLYTRRPSKEGTRMARERDDQPEDPASIENITEERAARRFHQIRHQEQMIQKLEKKIADTKMKLATLKEERDGVIVSLLAAARDEGDLPLFNMD